MVKKVIALLALTICSACTNKPNYLSDYSAKTDNGMVNIIIEIPAGTSEKWEVMKPDGNLALEYKKGKPRIIQYLPYPFNYGMIPGTLLSEENGGDGDPLDVVVIGEAITRGSVINAKIIGVLKMLDKGEQDDKIIAIATNSPLAHIDDVTQLKKKYPGTTKIISTWFKNYKGQKKIKIQGYKGPEIANDIINKALLN